MLRGAGVSVTMYNLDGNHPVWQNNVQMAPKQMKVMEQTMTKLFYVVMEQMQWLLHLQSIS
jgi:hypothetical protein